VSQAVPIGGSARFGWTSAFVTFFCPVLFRPLVFRPVACSSDVRDIRDIASRFAYARHGLTSDGCSAVVDRVSDGVKLAADRRHGCRLAGFGKITLE